MSKPLPIYCKHKRVEALAEKGKCSACGGPIDAWHKLLDADAFRIALEAASVPRVVPSLSGY